MGQTGSGAGVGELAPFEQRVAAVVGDRLLFGVVNMSRFKSIRFKVFQIAYQLATHHTLCQPPTYSQPSSVRTNESWVDPGHLATIFVRRFRHHRLFARLRNESVSYSRTHIPLQMAPLLQCVCSRSLRLHWENGYLCKLRFDVCLVYCIIWKPYRLPG